MSLRQTIIINNYNTTSYRHGNFLIMSQLQEGQQVKFNVGQREMTGTVKEVATGDTGMVNVTAHGSQNDPRLIIEHDKTGTEFIRREDKVQPMGGKQGGNA